MISDSISIDKVLSSFTELWAPRIVAQAGSFDIRVAKFHGEYIWHTHADTDELFIVIAGELVIHLREDGQERTVTLGPHDVFVVRRGTEHKPTTSEEAHILMMETTGTTTTGDARDIPADIPVTTGRSLG
jgi:mannose-6-phosphate isomerase-like protein (cupin superfamily)